MAKDCMGGIRDPDWLDLPPINSLGMGVHSLANLPSNSTIKKKAAIIIMAIEVNATFINSFIENKKIKASSSDERPIGLWRTSEHAAVKLC